MDIFLIIIVVVLGGIAQVWWKEKQAEKAAAKQEQQRQELLNKYKHLKVNEIVFNGEIEHFDKWTLLQAIHGYDMTEATELLEEAQKSAKKAKLSKVRREISQKAQELYSEIPVDDNREHIPDDIKQFVWQRDKGKCVRCGKQENLEFDHIIPFSKGGSSTARNLQLLCTECNRDKSDKI
jgi:mannosyltransferase OCH1-like enzyme